MAVGCPHGSCGALKAAGPLVSILEPVLWCDMKNRFDQKVVVLAGGAAEGPRQMAVVTEKARDLWGKPGERGRRGTFVPR